jgi:rSAM/selenodomain-associated transferase 1
MQKRLFVVAKQPAAGQTKTRLCPPLTGETAAALYECFLRDTLDTLRAVPGVSRTIVHWPAESETYFRELAPDLNLQLQSGADLGARLDRLLSDAIADGAAQAVVMSSDSPNVPAAYVAQAFDLLDDGYDLALGPCDDGGYYLIGLKQPQPRLFHEVRMSTPDVVQDTLVIAAELGLRVGLTPLWYDVDTIDDLERLRTDLETVAPDVARHTRRFIAKL